MQGFFNFFAYNQLSTLAITASYSSDSVEMADAHLAKSVSSIYYGFITLIWVLYVGVVELRISSASLVTTPQLPPLVARRWSRDSSNISTWRL